MSDDSTPRVPRRDFLKQAAALTGAVGLAGAATGAAAATQCTAPAAGGPGTFADTALATGSTQAATAAAAPQPVAPQPVAPFIGYVFFGPDEAAFTEALVNLLCPADAYTPNGVDCGLATFFDRELAGPFGQGKGRYLRGPWRQGPPQMGLQLPLTPAQFFSAGVQAVNAVSMQRHGVGFEQLDAVQADALLHDIEAGKVQAPVPLQDWFNALVYPLFVQGCFADPVYGGNHDKVFWKMLGYPGLPATHAQDIVRFRGKPFPGAASPKSMLDFS
jgi:gluconate 2-dehydrogenase gamma chain